jgi:hypothetical protein
MASRQMPLQIIYWLETGFDELENQKNI